MKYVALFRGINVGGKNVVKMDNLVQLFHELGFCKVKTYIQSGNAVFETAFDEKSLQSVIHAGFLKRFGFQSCVAVRNIEEMKALIDHFPFSEEETAAAEHSDPQAEHLYVYFLDHPADQTQIDGICREYAGPDILRAGEREVYLLCHQSIRKSKLAIQTAKRFDSATVRNWKTVTKLYDLLISL